MSRIIGNQLPQMGMVLPEFGKLERLFKTYLEAAGVDWNKKLAKSLDTNHTIVDKQLVAALDQVSFFGEDFLPKEQEHMLIFGIKVSEAAAAGNPDVQNYIPGVNTAAVKNGRMSITTNGVIELRAMPLMDYVRAEEEASAGYLMLPRPIVWRAQTDLELQVNFITANKPVATTNIAIELNGMKLIS